MTDVVLSWSEVRTAAFVGLDRAVRALAQERRATYGQGFDWSYNLIGAIGECAVGKLLDRYPSRGPLPDVDDVGPYQVRSTTRRDGCLIVHETEGATTRYVLVRGDPPVLDVAGWIVGADAQCARYWREDVRHAAYFVPAAALSPIESLPELRR